jgi:hypothetical protein
MPPRVVKMMTTQPGACAPDNHRGWISLASLTQHSQEEGAALSDAASEMFVVLLEGAGVDFSTP